MAEYFGQLWGNLILDNKDKALSRKLNSRIVMEMLKDLGKQKI